MKGHVAAADSARHPHCSNSQQLARKKVYCCSKAILMNHTPFVWGNGESKPNALREVQEDTS